MRTLLITVMLAGPGLAVVNALVQGSELNRFLRDTPELSSSHDLETLKRLAGRQMRAALLQGVLLIIGPVCFFWGLMFNHLTPGDFVWILLPSVTVILIARSLRTLESKVWSLPAAGQDLETERDRIVKVWRTKPLPDW